MVTEKFLQLLVQLTTIVLAAAQLSLPKAKTRIASAVTGVVEAVFSTVSHELCATILLSDRLALPGLTSTSHHWSPRGVGVFEVTANGQDANATERQLSQLVGQARRLRLLSRCVSVVVASDDPAFLKAFGDWSVRGRLIVWPGRLLVLTRLSLQKLPHLHKIISMMNAMLGIVDDAMKNIGCSMYVQLPYLPRGASILRVASWSPRQGLSLTSSLPLFPDKFSRFLVQPTLLAASEENACNVLGSERDVQGGERITFAGPIPNLLDHIANALNFSYIYKLPPDRLWGFKYEDGTWSGMVGMVSREEADIGVGLFSVTATRAEVIDYTWPTRVAYWRMLGVRGRTEVDPWGFLLPMTPLVWAAVLTALLLLPLTMILLSSCASLKTISHENWPKTVLAFIRVLLQQDNLMSGYWWWERLVLGVWMMMTLVLTRSYAGNLMSLLAVRHIHEPFQTIRDVLDHRAVSMIWQADSALGQYLDSVQSGTFREVSDLEKIGRLKYKKLSEFPESMNTLVRRGDHVLVETDAAIRIYMSRDFSKTGLCSFYESDEGFLPQMLAFIGPKDSSIVPAMSKRMMAMTEAGLYSHWLRTAVPNATSCYRTPSKIAIRTSLSLKNVWGMFVVLTCGYSLSLLVLCLERLTSVC